MAEEQSKEPVKKPLPPGESPTILVVEDDRFLNKVYRSKLSKEGFNALFANDGEEGLTVLLHSKPDLVLLDMVMPKMSGFQLLEAMRNNDDLKDIRVLVLSNLGQEEDIKRVKALGALEFIIKSETSIDDVIEKIRGYLTTE